MTPTRRALLIWLVSCVALLFYPGGLIGGVAGTLGVFNGLLVLVVFIDWLCAPRVNELTVQRGLPAVVTIGNNADVSWTFENGSARKIRFQFVDEVVPSLGLSPDPIAVVIAARDSALVTTRMCPSRRGYFEFSRLALRVRSPLGLSWHDRSLASRSALRVHPYFKSKDEAELRIRKARILEIGLRSARGLGGGTEFEQLREYGPDDEFRRIDWAASARVGRPIVRTYRPEKNQSVMVMIDNGRMMAAQVDGVRRLDHAMDAATMMVAVGTRLGDKVGLVTFDQEVRSVVAPSRHSNQVVRATEAMYRLEPVLAESDYRSAFAGVLGRFRRRSLLIILTDLNEQAIRASMVGALTMVLRTHVVVVAAVTDPQVQQWANSSVVDSEQAFRKVAASDDLQARQRTKNLLTAAGVTVVDCPPGRLGNELCDVYLKMKSTGRL